MADEDNLITEMETVLEDMEKDPPAEEKPPPAEPTKEPDPQPTKERVKFENGFPNPLGIELTVCHLPKVMCEDKKVLCAYVRKHLDPKAMAGITPSKNERTLYAEYVRVSRPKRPVTPRMFSAAARLIVQGKPIDDPEEEPFDAFAL